MGMETNLVFPNSEGDKLNAILSNPTNNKNKPESKQTSSYFLFHTSHFLSISFSKSTFCDLARRST